MYNGIKKLTQNTTYPFHIFKSKTNLIFWRAPQKIKYEFASAVEVYSKLRHMLCRFLIVSYHFFKIIVLQIYSIQFYIGS
jgi:hypothetical protein